MRIELSDVVAAFAAPMMKKLGLISIYADTFPVTPAQGEGAFQIGFASTTGTLRTLLSGFFQNAS